VGQTIVIYSKSEERIAFVHANCGAIQVNESGFTLYDVFSFVLKILNKIKINQINKLHVRRDLLQWKKIKYDVSNVVAFTLWKLWKWMMKSYMFLMMS
jgi:hypothetical protein